MNNKFLVKISVPLIEKTYEVWIPPTKQIGNLIRLLVYAIREQSKDSYCPNNLPCLYNKDSAQMYDEKLRVIDTDIRNGMELILI